jgi:hypothetical protein
MTPRQAAAIARLSSFVEARGKLLGLDPEYVYSIHVDPSSDQSEHIRMSDLRTLLAMVSTPTSPQQ